MKIKAQFFSLRFGPTDPVILKNLIRAAADSGMNMVCLEVERGLRYRSHPDVSAPWAMARETLSEVVRLGRELGLEMVPLLPTFSHVGYILSARPELRESPRGGIYCPSNPAVYKLVFALMTELIEIFRPRYFHIGHDEAISAFDPRFRVSIFGCSRCRRVPPHRLYLNDIRVLHGFLEDKGIRTMMWADGLLETGRFKDACFGQSNGVYGGPPDNLQRALPMLPRDIVMCDWHYDPAREYPTVRYLQERGFETLGCPEFPVNSFLFTRYAHQHRTRRFLGMMATSWHLVDGENSRRLRRFTRHHGFCFNHPGRLPGDSMCRRAAAACRGWDRPFSPGRFHGVYSFGLEGRGIYHSRGWRNLRYIEYPASDIRLRGAARPAALEIKARRCGEIEYEFRAAPGHVFEAADIRLWLRSPGRYALLVRAAGSAKQHAAVRDVTLRGKTIPLASFVKGRPAFRVKFAVENTGDQNTSLLARFDLTGRCVRKAILV